MTLINLPKMAALATLRLGVLAAFLAAAGCSDPIVPDKSNDPELKASMEKRVEIYKAKARPSKKGPLAAKSGP